jgi:hypothetical protein
VIILFKIFLVIICYITTISDYFIINYCWLLYVIVRLLMIILLFYYFWIFML